MFSLKLAPDSQYDAQYPYKIGYSCRFNDSDSAKTERTIGAAATNGTIFTLSWWMKTVEFSTDLTVFSEYEDANNYCHITKTSANVIQMAQATGGVVDFNITAIQHTPIDGWDHYVIRYDSTQGAAADRWTLWINNSSNTGIRWTDIDLNEVCRVTKNTEVVTVGAYNNTKYMHGYLAEMRLIDGQALTPSSFGESINDVWVPKYYTGTYGNNGFYLDFEDNTDFGNDVSGNNNDFTDTNLATNDQVPDTPTNDHCIINCLDNNADGDHPVGTISNAGLYLDETAGTLNYGYGTIPLPSSGIWEFQIAATQADNTSNAAYWGLKLSEKYYGIATAALRVYAPDGQYYNGSGWGAYGATWTTETMTCVADVDNGTIHFYKSGVDQGEAQSGLTLQGAKFLIGVKNTILERVVIDFGQHGFTRNEPKSKYLNCLNLPDISSDVYPPTKGFDSIAYTGTGAEHARTDLSFQPDLVWIKNRDQNDEFVITDSVRGATKELNCDSDNVESTVAQGLKTFDSNGFTLGTDDRYNTFDEDYIAWCLKEGPEYGFDIVTYSGTGIARTVNHNLGAAPELMFIKERTDDAGSWMTYHDAVLSTVDPETDYGRLDLANAWADLDTIWNDTAPTSTQFTVGTHDDVNAADDTYVAYLFRSIENFSKVFRFEGNGNANNAFVSCGFRPGFMFYKNADAALSWIALDRARDPAGYLGKYVTLNSTVAEGDLDLLNFTAQGFKLLVNTFPNNQTYIGIVFAYQPGRFSNGN
jgi:hypothetical protein